MPLARDFTDGRRMLYRDKSVIYVGRSYTGAFVFSKGFRDFISLWPFELLVPDEPEHPIAGSSK